MCQIVAAFGAADEHPPVIKPPPPPDELEVPPSPRRTLPLIGPLLTMIDAPGPTDTTA